jgi:hypothetical protein
MNLGMRSRKAALADLRRSIRTARALRRGPDRYAVFRLVGRLTSVRPGALRQMITVELTGIAPCDVAARWSTNALHRFVTKHLYRELTLAVHDRNHAIAASMPAIWRKWLMRDGYRVSSLKSSLRWMADLMRMAGGSTRRLAGLIRYSLREVDVAVPPVYWVAEKFSAPALAPSGSTMAAFLMGKCGADGLTGTVWGVGSVTRITETGGYILAPFPFPSLGGRWTTLRFGLRGTLALVRAALRAMAGAPDALLNANDVLDVLYVSELPTQRLPHWYVISNSTFGARPLWTFDAESRGVRCAMVFYSANNKPMNFIGQPSGPVLAGYEFMNWPTYFVWDKWQADWVRSVAQGTCDIIPLGYIPLHDRSGERFAIPANAVAVFDVALWRDANLADEVGYLAIYYEAKIITAFLMDIQAVLERAGLVMLVKPKRGIDTRQHKAQRRIYEQLRAKPNVIVLPDDVPPIDVIKNTLATISLPFTSTSVAADLIGKPAAYYDPSGTLEDDRAMSHGLEVLRHPNALAMWLQRIVVMVPGPAMDRRAAQT